MLYATEMKRQKINIRVTSLAWSIDWVGQCVAVFVNGAGWIAWYPWCPWCMLVGLCQGGCGAFGFPCRCITWGPMSLCVVDRVLLQLLRCSKIKTVIGQD